MLIHYLYFDRLFTIEVDGAIFLEAITKVDLHLNWLDEAMIDFNRLSW